MRTFRKAFEGTVLAWPGVARKEMMGCLVYFRGKRFFAFLVTGGLVITKLPDADRAALAKRRGAKAFAMSGRTSSKWVQLSVAKPAAPMPAQPARSMPALARPHPPLFAPTVSPSEPFCAR